MQFDPPIAFVSARPAEPALIVRVNFGILAGREATPAEIDELARELLGLVPEISIISEQHYEVSRGHEAVVHQVRIELAPEAVNGNADAVRDAIVGAATHWAQACADARHAEL